MNLPAASALPDKPRVLLVEDDSELAAATAEYLQKQDLTVHVVGNGDQVAAQLRRLNPHLMVLDVMLPGKDGFEVCKELRAAGISVPIIMLTAKNEDFDQVLGLELGADDYLMKPVQPRVLLARIKAQLRRAYGGAPRAGEAEQLQFGRLTINRSNREVILGDSHIYFSRAEFDLLWLLASNAGRVIQRNDILHSLRGLEDDGSDRSIDARLYRMRKRFGDNPEVVWRIKSIRPQGYMFTTDPW